MAFGFFRRAAEYADTVFTGGTVYTGDADGLWAEAVAVKDGCVMAVGDAESIGELAGDETEIVDLSGKFLFPGFIDTCGSPVLRVFEGQYFAASAESGLEEVLEEFRTFAEAEPERGAYFGVGYNERILKGLPVEERRSALDRVSADKPVVLLSANGFSAWLNHAASDKVKAAAEEDEVKQITLPYLMNVIDCLDFEEMERRVLEVAGEYSELGVTSVLNRGSIDYFDSVYQDILLDLLAQDMLKQRFFGTLCIAQSVDLRFVMAKLRQRQTYCSEVEWGIAFSGLDLELSEKSGFGIGGDAEDAGADRADTDADASAGYANANADADCDAEEGADDDSWDDEDAFPDPQLVQMMEDANDAGFDVRVTAHCESAALSAAHAMKAARGTGYGKSRFLMENAAPLSEDARRQLEESGLGETITETLMRSGADGRLTLSAAAPENARSVEEAIDLLTIDAADVLGADGLLGSISPGKAADFAVFEQNPLELPNLTEFRKLRAVMTVVNGQIVYDEEEDVRAEWYDLISGMHM